MRKMAGGMIKAFASGDFCRIYRCAFFLCACPCGGRRGGVAFASVQKSSRTAFHGHTTADFWLVHHVTSYSVTPDVVSHFEWEARWTEVSAVACHWTIDRLSAVISGALYLRAPPVVA